MRSNGIRLLLSSLLLGVVVNGQDGVENNCGDCWCLPEEGQECPALGEEYHYNVKPEWAILKSFQLVSPQLELQTADGSEDCSPFSGIDLNYDENQFDPCVVSPTQAGNYCGYKYPNGGETEDLTTRTMEECEGRDYEMITYDSLDALEADGADLVHSGACGVCSNAQDVWNKMDVLDSVGARTTFCAITFITSQDFDATWDCIADIGWSRPCAFVWTHYTIANALSCQSVCLPNKDNEIEGNGPAPECEYSSCIQCSADALDETLYKLTGFSGQKGGIVDRTITHPCSTFTPVNYDPCAGAKASDSVNEGPETSTPGSSSGARTTVLHLSFFGVALLWCVTTDRN